MLHLLWCGEDPLATVWDGHHSWLFYLLGVMVWVLVYLFPVLCWRRLFLCVMFCVTLSDMYCNVFSPIVFCLHLWFIVFSHQVVNLCSVLPLYLMSHQCSCFCSMCISCLISVRFYVPLQCFGFACFFCFHCLPIFVIWILVLCYWSLLFVLFNMPCLCWWVWF